MATYKIVPLTQATERQTYSLSEEDYTNAKAIVSEFVTLFKAKHLQ